MKKHFTTGKRCFLGFRLILALVVAGWNNANGQQVPDYDFDPKISDPSYSLRSGPLVIVDEAHHNFHTIAGRYNAFSKVLNHDGYLVEPGKKPFTSESLNGVKILVIANALHVLNKNQWSLPTPSAFTNEEIATLNQWVRKGGSLLLIADHMPFPGSNEALAKSFGFTFYNGFANDSTSGAPGAKRELDVFKRSAKTLESHPITDGQKNERRVDHVATFTGQAFQIPEKAVSLLTFREGYQVLLPDTAWKFSTSTPRIAAKGFSQGAVLDYGKGRLAVFGEAAMFSSQLKGKDKIPFGLRSPDADQNLTFLRNLISWLDNPKKQ
jgi:hypothetical protein